MSRIYLDPQAADRVYLSAAAGDFPLPSAWHGLALASEDPEALALPEAEPGWYVRWVSPFGVDLYFRADPPERKELAYVGEEPPALSPTLLPFEPVPPSGDETPGGTEIDRGVFNVWMVPYDVRPGTAGRLLTPATPYAPGWGAGFLRRAAELAGIEAYALGEQLRARYADVLWRMAEVVERLPKDCLPSAPLGLFWIGEAPLAIPLEGGEALFLVPPTPLALGRLLAAQEGRPVPFKVQRFRQVPEGLLLEGETPRLLRGYSICGHS